MKDSVDASQVAIQYQSWFSFRATTYRPWSWSFVIQVAIQYQSWFSFRGSGTTAWRSASRWGRNPVSILVFIPSCRSDQRRISNNHIVAIQYQSWFSFRVISLGQAEELPNWVSQSSINPGFHSERFYPRPRHGPFGRVAIQYQSWFSFRAKPKVEFETVTRTGRNPVSILVFIPSLFRTAWVLCSNPYCRNPVSILVFIPSWVIDHLHLS